MTEQELMIALNAAIGLVTALATAYQQLPDAQDAVKAQITALLPALAEANDAVQAYRPLPPPAA
jgi:hypothetical protein